MPNTSDSKMYNDYIQTICDKWAKKFSDLEHARDEAIAAAALVVQNNRNLQKLLDRMEQDQKLHLERIERDTARISQLHTERDNWMAAAQEAQNDASPAVWKKRYHDETVIAAQRQLRIVHLKSEIEHLQGLVSQTKDDLQQVRTERDNYKKQIPNPDFIDSRIAEFQRVVKMLRERGDRWKERCIKRREEIAIWASRAFKARKERDEARVTVAAQAQVVADQAKRLESVESDKTHYMRMLMEARNEVEHLKADLTRALDSRTVKPFKSHPGC